MCSASEVRVSPSGATKSIQWALFSPSPPTVCAHIEFSELRNECDSVLPTCLRTEVFDFL